MNIVKGRGKRREVIELPHGSVFQQGAKTDPRHYATVVDTVCEIVGVTPAKY